MPLNFRFLTGAFFFFGFHFQLQAQIIASPDTTIGCNDTITLTATTVAATGTQVLLSDDSFSGIVNIGFPFTWYGTTYQQCLISSNNYLTFNLAGAGGFSPWSIAGMVPSGANPTNAAMGPWQDINPGVGGSIRYATVGVAPNRIFVVEYCNIPMFSCTNLAFSSQIQLHESGNAMETHIISKPLCTSWNSGQAIHATHNPAGTAATVVPGRNAGSQWTTSNEGYRFTPSGATTYTLSSVPFAPIILGPSPGAIVWTENGATIGTGPSVTVSPSVTTSYVASVSGGCSGIQFKDTVVVTVPTTGSLTLTSSLPSGSSVYEGCGNVTLNFTRTGSLSGVDTLVLTTTGTATEGVDYTAIQDTVIFSAGMATWSVTINAFTDLLAEGSETMNLQALFLDPCVTSSLSYQLLIDDLPPIIVDAGNDTIICPGGSAVLTATGTGGVYGYPLIYTWDNGVNGPTQTVQPGSTTTYVITATDSCGLVQDVDSVTVTINPSIVLDAGDDDALCAGDTVQLNATSNVPVLWTPSAGLSTDSITNPFASPAYTTTYYITASDGVCTDIDSLTVTVNPLPVVTSGPQDTVICLSNPIFLHANGADTYAWINSSGIPFTGEEIADLPVVTTTYYVTGTDVNGCEDSDSLTVTVNPALSIEAFGDTSLCGTDNTIPLSAVGAGGNGGPYTYTWTPGDFLSSTTGDEISAIPLDGVNYIVTLQDNCGTPAVTDTVAVTVFPDPTAFFSADPLVTDMINPRIFFEDSSYHEIVNWHWEIGEDWQMSDPSFEFVFPEAGIYPVTLTVTNVFGCTAFYTETVTITPQLLLYVPNAFTPNGDGVNDLFKPVGTDIKDYTLQVFNRWGNLVFETSDLSKGWNGTYHGGRAPQDVYVFKISAVNPADGSTIIREGTVTLVR